MDNKSAIAGLGALAQGTRLDVFRVLVRHEPDGMAAGGLGVGWSALGGAAVALLAGVVSLSDVPVV